MLFSLYNNINIARRRRTEPLSWCAGKQLSTVCV